MTIYMMLYGLVFALVALVLSGSDREEITDDEGPWFIDEGEDR